MYSRLPLASPQLFSASPEGRAAGKETVMVVALHERELSRALTP